LYVSVLAFVQYCTRGFWVSVEALQTECFRPNYC